MATKRSVIVKGCPIVNEEGVASETIKPGYLVKGVSTIAKQTGDGVKVPNAVALERDEMGKGIDNTYQGSAGSAFYASGDVVKVGVFGAGMEAVLFVASGANISEDDYLESTGNGLVEELGSGIAIARAKETIGAVTSETALRVEFL